MPQQPEELTATYLAERFRFANPAGDVVIIDAHANSTINGPVTLKGPAEIDELQRNQTYRFYGHWSSYKNKRTGKTEQQFHFTSFTRQRPHNREGVVAYLRQAGEGHYFGVARAAALWEAFGPDAVQVLRETPALAAEELTRRRLPLAVTAAEAIATKLRTKEALEACIIDTTELLANRGFRKTLPRLVINEWGNKAAEILRSDPHRLWTTGFAGCGFRNCDAMYLSLGLPPGRLERQALAAVYSVQDGADGSSWVPRQMAERGIKALVASADLRIDEAIQLALDNGWLREIRTLGANGPISPDGDFVWLAEAEHAANECRLAELVAAAMDEVCAWPDVSTVPNIDGEQPDVLRLALRGAIAILGGRPGAGKTFTAANLIQALIAEHGEGAIGIGAPTNLAAQKLTQAMAEYGVAIRARTNHSLLGMPDPIKQPGAKWRHNAKNPFPFKVLVIDEGSMPDTEIVCAIFEARAKGTHVLLIGDIRQLLPVSTGAPLRDLIAAGLPYGELREIRRNSGGIVEACSAIADGQKWGEGDNLKIVQVEYPEGQRAAVLQIMEEVRQSGLDPVWDTRVIVARNEVRRSFNRLLQSELNPNPMIDGSPFRLGDKVICRDNADFEIVTVDRSDEEAEVSQDGNKVRVANGELGQVLEVGDKHLVVRVSAPDRVVRVPRTPVYARSADAGQEDDGSGDGQLDKTGTGCAWDLAYAVTYHSSQGSEFPWAIVVGSKRDVRMGCRELVYTGISRAKQQCRLVGTKSTFDAMCKRVALNERKTLLREQVLLERAKRALATL